MVGESRAPGLSDRDRLPYTNATLREVMRVGNTGNVVFFTKRQQIVIDSISYKLYTSYGISWANFSQNFGFYSDIFGVCSFFIFKRSQGTSIPLNYINFTKTTNKWIVGDITRPFGNYEMLILKIKQ